jgi:hypothetical protein
VQEKKANYSLSEAASNTPVSISIKPLTKKKEKKLLKRKNAIEKFQKKFLPKSSPEAGAGAGESNRQKKGKAKKKDDDVSMSDLG